MVEKGLLVTVVLDSRGIGAPLHNATAALRDQWPVKPDGYTVLLACGPHEIARELELSNGERRGALSYFLMEALSALRRRGADVTHESHYEDIRIRFHASWPRQTPMCYGNGRLSFFDGTPTTSSTPFVSIYKTNNSLCLDAGEAHGVHTGDTYMLYPPDRRGDTVSQVDNISVTARVDTVRCLTSDLTDFEPETARKEIGAGWRAKPLTSLSQRKISVRLPASVYERVHWTRALEDHGYLYFCISNDDSEACMFNVVFDDQGCYKILDGSGGTVANIPAIPANPEGAEQRLMDTLQHLSKFKYAEGIENRIPDTAFERLFSLVSSVGGGEPSNSSVFDVEHGGTWQLEIENKGETALYFALFNFTPSWKIDNLLSESSHNGFWVLEPKTKEILPLEMEVPEFLQSNSTGMKDQGSHQVPAIPGAQELKIANERSATPDSIISIEMPHPGMKEQELHQVPTTIPDAQEPKITNQMEAESTNLESLDGSYTSAGDEIEELQSTTGDYDSATTYSTESLSDDPKLLYLQVFAEQLAKDMKQVSDEFCFENIEAGYLDDVLKEFAWKLHNESSNPFQWEASVILNRKRKNIIELLVPRPLDHDVIGSQDSESKLSEDEDQDESSNREIFRKSKATVKEWINEVEPSPHAGEELSQATADGPVQDDIEHEYGSKRLLLQQAHNLEILPQLPNYEQFIRVSDAYQWLLNKVRQHGLLTFQAPNAMLEIGTKIRNQLRAQEPLRKMSSRKPLSVVKMTFCFDWNLDRSMRDASRSPPDGDALGRMVCLTGSWDEGQATTMKDYMDQTWPRSGALIALMQTLLSTPEGQECSDQAHEFNSPKHRSDAGAARLTACVQSPSVCCISVTGGPYFVSEIGEQIGWLASALQFSSDHHGPVACTPSINDLQVHLHDEGSHGLMVVGSLRGYPILRRTQPNTGLEMSLANMAAIIGSQQVVQWGERMIVKGFNMLMIATLVAADIIVWHLLVSEQLEERISYIDPRLDTLYGEATKEISLRMLEERRHVIGWCSKATELCGDATANLNLKSSGLLMPPAAIVIDRLYIGARADFGAGLNMSFNKKQKPFWLMRENDYPSLLKWVGVQPIVFYDVADHRAWLTDGASALLHLVRASLYLDQNDPESVYDWVFDATQLKDKWDGFSGRQAALKTLKSWDNLNLNVYVVRKQRRSDGGFETEYATLETRIKKILHSIEILIDKQAMSSSQDGIRIPQTLDIRRDIIGFDIQDIIDPCSAIRSRIKHLDSWGHGWVDLIPSIGTTTIFGQGFGDLICPKEPHALCSEWKSVPKGKDYMAASVSTLQMLYKQRLLRLDSGLSPGQMTSKIVWVSPNPPFKSCECLQRSTSNTEDGDFHTTSVQFLIAKKSLRSRLVLRGSTPVDVMTLDEKGAVVFGHIPFLSRKSESKFAAEQQDEDLDAASSVELSNRGTLRSSSASPAASELVTSAGSVAITSSSLEASLSVEVRSDDNEESDKKGKRWRRFMKFLR
ncbi:hypothetical protein THAR02_07334 [Trichoderma harzianum]|uniref:Uncharacterized protein n=1 Tax=Trichoderma harzianum TaxID=5544 RepID=A0A0F9X5W4_TRIHA|nr:hypothetical protein THAR02_07334 [Trichoderma harzianum]